MLVSHPAPSCRPTSTIRRTYFTELRFVRSDRCIIVISKRSLACERRGACRRPTRPRSRVHSPVAIKPVSRIRIGTVTKAQLFFGSVTVSLGQVGAVTILLTIIRNVSTWPSLVRYPCAKQQPTSRIRRPREFDQQRFMAKASHADAADTRRVQLSEVLSHVDRPRTWCAGSPFNAQGRCCSSMAAARSRSPCSVTPVAVVPAVALSGT